MGDIANAMINGDLCGTCGCCIDGEGRGFPRYCSKDCNPNISDEQAKKENQEFFKKRNEKNKRRAIWYRDIFIKEGLPARIKTNEWYVGIDQYTFNPMTGRIKNNTSKKFLKIRGVKKFIEHYKNLNHS